MKKFAIVVAALSIMLIAAGGGDYTWHDLLSLIIVLIVAAIGSPITQFFKNALKIEDKLAVVLTAVVAFVFALLEVWLGKLLDFQSITIDNIPNAFFMVYTIASIYYGLLKNSDGILGKKFLLRQK